MSEQRKIQLATEVDATGAKQGFEQVKQGARDMAQAVTQSGQQAGKGLDAIGEGAKRNADGFNREEGRMRASIQRATLDLQNFGKAASARLEAKIDLQGLDPAKFRPYLAALREAEAAQARLATERVGSDFLEGMRAQIGTLREQIQLQQMSTEEVLRYKAAQAGVSELAEPLIADLQKARAAQEALTEATRQQAAAQKEAAAALSRRNSFLDGLKQQADAIGKTRADLAELQAAQLGLTAQAAPFIARLREAERGHLAMGAGAKLNAFQMQQLGFQLHDFGVQVLSGQNALVAFVQQGSQLSGTFGGAKNAFQAVLSLLTPMRVAMIGAAASVGALALALSHAETAARGLNSVQALLAGTGRGGMFSTKELDAFIRQLSLAPGVTRETATAIVSELSKVREIGGTMFRDLAGAAADYAKATGTDIPTAAKALARAFADPEKGAKQLDETLGILSSSQLVQIERLTRLGDTAGAQRLLFDALQGSIKGLADNAMTPLQKATNDLGNSWERAMHALDQSQGLRTLNELLAKTVNFVQFLVDNVDKVGGLGNVGLASVPGGTPFAVGNVAAGAIRSTLGLKGPLFGGDEQRGSAEGGWTGTKPGDPTDAAASAAVGATGKAVDDEIKKVRELTVSYRSNASQIAELTGLRERLTKAIEASTKAQDANTPAGRQLTEDLRGRLSGVNERIASIGKKNRNTEPDQIARAELEGRVRAVRDALTSEREALSFQERFLQGAFQAGESTMVEYFDRKREAIERGVQAEVAALDQEIAALQAYQAKIAKKDPSAAVQAGERIEDARREQERLRNRASNEVALANQQQEASFRQLNDQVTAYRANLLQLQGDEEGAARLRAQQAIEQAQILARQAGAGVDVQGLRQASDQNITLSTTRRQTTEVQTRLQMREERIAQDQRAGSITTLDSLAAVSEGRRKAVAELEELVRAQEEVARSRPKDYQLQIDTERARHELELLKGELDPLQEQFRNLFTDAGTDFFTSLMEGKGLKGALKAFGDMVGREINGVVGRELSEQLFGKNGALGGAGGFLADIFGKGGEAGKSAATASSAAAITAETTARTTATAAITAASTSSAAALSAMTAAASAAAAALSAVAASSGAGAASGFASALGSGPGFLNDLGGLEVFGSLGFSDGGFTGHMDTKKAAGVVHGQEYVFSAPAVKAIGVDRLERMHRKAKTGQDVEEELPGYSAGGYVAVLGTSPQTLRRGNQYLMALQAPPPVKSGDTYVTHHTNHVNVTATPGTTRQTALQTGREVGRGIEMARARNGR